MPTQPNQTIPQRPPLYRHDSANPLPKPPKPLTPQSLTNTFPCSRRPNPKKTATRIVAASPLRQLPQEDRLQTALLYLARAAAQLPPASTSPLAESLRLFAWPNCTAELWEVVVEKERGAAGAGAGAGTRRQRSGGEGEAGSAEVSAGKWVKRAVEVLMREGEEGEYWRDGQDLQALWEKVCGD
jgi:hypothetical protein